MIIHMLQNIFYPTIVVINSLVAIHYDGTDFSCRLVAKPNGLKWARNAILNAFQLANGGCLWYHAKASSYKDTTNTSWNLVTCTLPTTHVIPNFAQCIGICTMLVILGVGLTIELGNGSNGKGGIGDWEIENGVKIFWPTCTRKILEVGPKFSCWGLRGDKFFLWLSFSPSICISTLNSLSRFPICNFSTDLNQLFLLSTLFL